VKYTRKPTLGLTISNSAFCVCGFRMVFRINSDYFFKQHWPAEFCNADVLCFLCGTDWILKYYSQKHRL